MFTTPRFQQLKFQPDNALLLIRATNGFSNPDPLFNNSEANNWLETHPFQSHSLAICHAKKAIQIQNSQICILKTLQHLDL